MISSVNYTTYLPRAIDVNKIDASVKNGILTITLERKEESKPKKVTIKVG